VTENVTKHAVVIAGGGPTGMMLAGELALAGVDVAIVERRPNQELTGWRAGGLHSRTIEIFDQRGIADRFLAEGQVVQAAGFAGARLDISDFPTRYPHGLGLRQKHIERILAGWVGELGAPPVNAIADPPVNPCNSRRACVSFLIVMRPSTLMIAATRPGSFGTKSSERTSPTRRPLKTTAPPRDRPETEPVNKTS